MATIIPVINSDTDKQHKPAQAGDKLDPSLIMLDNNSENLLRSTTTGLSVRAEDAVSDIVGNVLMVQDGKLYVLPESIPSQLSLETGNYLRLGNDGNIFVDGNDILSNEADNSLGISIVDGRIYFKEKNMLDWLSNIPCQLLVVDNEGKLKLCASDILSDDNGNSLVIGTDNKIYYKGVVLSDEPCQLLVYDTDGNIKLCAEDLISTDIDNGLVVGSDGKLYVEVSGGGCDCSYFMANKFATNTEASNTYYTMVPSDAISIIMDSSSNSTVMLTIANFITPTITRNVDRITPTDITDLQGSSVIIKTTNYGSDVTVFASWRFLTN